MADNFGDWITGPEQQRTIREGGYYQVLIRPGLRLISLNTNACNNFNFYLMLDFDDPWHHLHWVYSVLKEAEEEGERVVILGHIPTGDESCFSKKGEWA